MKNYLEFEKEIKALEEEVDNLKSPFGSEGISEVDTQKIKTTQEEINEKLRETYSNLNSWQKTLVARHEDRPKANFYIKKIFQEFTLLSELDFIILLFKKIEELNLSLGLMFKVALLKNLFPPK